MEGKEAGGGMRVAVWDDRQGDGLWDGGGFVEGEASACLGSAGWGEGKLKMNSMESAGGTKKPAVLRGNGGFF